jgi:hypothetical protein
MSPHDSVNDAIRRRGFTNVELAYDGLVLKGFHLE